MKLVDQRAVDWPGLNHERRSLLGLHRELWARDAGDGITDLDDVARIADEWARSLTFCCHVLVAAS
jgi:hypothetical protein